MRYTLFAFALAAFLGFSPISAQANHTAEHANLHTISIQVNGLVCDFCARALEKVFYKQDGVEGVKVDLDTHLVELDVQDGTKLPDDLITQLVTDSGYNVVSIEHQQ